MPTLQRDGSVLRDETNRYSAAVQTEGYVSGVKGGSFADKSTGACDQGFGAVHLVGWFEDVPEMEQVFDAYKGATALYVDAPGGVWSVNYTWK